MTLIQTNGTGGDNVHVVIAQFIQYGILFATVIAINGPSMLCISSRGALNTAHNGQRLIYVSFFLLPLWNFLLLSDLLEVDSQ